ncbi:Tn3 family transposase [Streptosporangium canum]|uniref:Tn3 family transposase n=1 Tax=Streptosporangium canum TaxID=324952 RepID=UPI0033B31871
METLLEVTEYGEELRLEQVGEAIDAIAPRRELREAVAAVTDMVPPPDVDSDGEMRALPVSRIATVSGFLKTLTSIIEFAQALGGGLVAAIDGMRFVVPAPSIYTRPNRKYFGRARGITWLNMINDRGVGLGAKVVTGTVRDSLHMIDVAFRRDGGQRPEVLVTDTGSYSDVVFGLIHLLGMQYRPGLADTPDQKGWRIQDADYGSLSRFARGKIDNVIGTYSFAQPDLGPSGVRQLRNPDEPDWEEDLL